MRLEEYEAKYLINYNPNNVESMGEGLKKYIHYIDSKKGFENNYCVVHFNCEIQISLANFSDHKEIYDYLKHKSYYSDPQKSDEDIQSWTTTETLFFACALMHEALKEDVVKACEAITKFSRKENDSYEMWLTCESPFGIEPLRLLSYKYPSYGYLLAGYLIQNWDDEHMFRPLYDLSEWSEEKGICQDTIKAYCYCDHSYARELMFGYDAWNDTYNPDESIDSKFDLVAYFQESAKRFDDFVDMLIERYNDQPFVSNQEVFDGEKIIRERILEMMFVKKPYDDIDEGFDVDDYLTQLFINEPCDQTIEKIGKLLNEKVMIKEVESIPYEDDYHDDEDIADIVALDDDEEGLENEPLSTLEDCIEYMKDEFLWGSFTYETLENCYDRIDTNKDEILHQINSAEFTQSYRYDEMAMLLLSYILYVDKDDFDEQSQCIKEYIENHLSNLIKNVLSAAGEWSKFEAYEAVKDKVYDNDYQINYKNETIDKYNKFKPIEIYLSRTDQELITSPVEIDGWACDDLLPYFKKHLDIVKMSPISDFQPRYELFEGLNGDTIGLIYTLYYLFQMEGYEEKYHCKRVISLLLRTAPIKVMKALEKIIEPLSKPDSMYAYNNALEELRDFGLEEPVYYIYQLISLNEKLDFHEIDDIDRYPFGGPGYQFIRLYQLYLQKTIRLKVSHSNIFAMFLPEIEKILKHIRQGERYLSTNDKWQLYKKCPIGLKDVYSIQTEVNFFIMELMSRYIKENAQSLPQYIVNRAKLQKVETKEFWIYGYQYDEPSTKEFLKLYEAKILEDNIEEDDVFKGFNDNEFPMVLINKTAQGSEVVFGKTIIDLFYTNIVKEKYVDLHGFKVGIINDCPKEILDLLSSHVIDKFRNNCLRTLSQYMISGDNYEEAKYIAQCGLEESREYSQTRISDANLKEIMWEASMPLKKRVLDIMGRIDAKNLAFHKNNLETDFMMKLYNDGIDREVIFKYAMAQEDEILIQWMAKKVNCEVYATSLRIEKLIVFLEAVRNLSAYHPFVNRMTTHSSVKVQKVSREISKALDLLNTGEALYDEVDYGVYKMQGKDEDSQIKNVSKVANEPVCVNKTSFIKGVRNTYFGLRFTAIEPEKAPKVLIHKVWVKYPVIKDDGIFYETFSWEQNGYSENNIFAGWYFDDEEIVEGIYTFRILDLNGRIIVDRIFEVYK